jgi:hypothetical protein
MHVMRDVHVFVLEVLLVVLRTVAYASDHQCHTYTHMCICAQVCVRHIIVHTCVSQCMSLIPWHTHITLKV